MKKIAVAAALTGTFIFFLHGFAHAAPPQPARRSVAGGEHVIGSRPQSCPHAWCGCGLRKYLGLADTSLNLAWEWARKFPRTYAHAGAIAVRHHHVMQLVSHISGSEWMVRSYNDYRRLGWIRARDVSGFIFVDVPRHWASLEP